MRISFSDSARRDLAGIYAYHAERNPNSAGRIVGAILKAVNGLAQFPYLGRPAEVPGMRERILSRYPYKIIYMIGGDEIEVARVIHTAQEGP